MLDADPERAEEIRVEIAEIESLAGLDFTKMTEEQRRISMMVLTYAEQEEMGVAHAHGTRGEFGAIGREALAKAKMFRKYRHDYWGKNQLEAFEEIAETYTQCADGQFRNKDGKLMPFRTLL